MLRRAAQLPENQEIYVQARSCSWGVLVEYTGPSLAALLTAGCISQMMADQCKSAGRTRMDEYGDPFYKNKRPLKGWHWWNFLNYRDAAARSCINRFQSTMINFPTQVQRARRRYRPTTRSRGCVVSAVKPSRYAATPGNARASLDGCIA